MGEVQSEGYVALRESAAWLYLSGRGKIVARGEDRARLLHAMTTNHVQQLEPGKGCYTFFLNAQGHVLGDANLFASPDHILLDTEPETALKLFSHLERYIIADDVTLENATQRTATIGLDGPKAEEVLASLGGPAPASATYLLAGLGTDTDWFRLATVDPVVFRLAADLVEAGAKPCDVFDALYMSDEMTKVLLRGRAIESLHLALEDRVAVMRLPRSLFRELGADIGDTENLITECMKIRGAVVGVMLVEADEDEVRLSLRSRPPINVLRVAKEFGGGGHLRAAGARLTGSLDAVEKQVLASIAVSLAAARS